MIVQADARHIPLADNTVQCVVTSPPYWGLRKYAGNQERVWGGNLGDAADPFPCEHKWISNKTRGEIRGYSSLSVTGNHPREIEGALVKVEYDQPFCDYCGAWRGAFGLEPTIEMYVQHSVEILREVRRVMRPDGVCFWNIGDSYSSIGHKKSNSGYGTTGLAGGIAQEHSPIRRENNGSADGLKHKDLCLIPARVALAAQADGWWVRSDIIWAKPNPMPESVRDRPTDAYEHVLELGKSRPYLTPIEAIWLAASLDSDGCIRIGIYRHKKQATGYGAQVIFDGRSERLVRRVADVAGCGSMSFNNHSQAWTWRASAGDAEWILRQIEPFLVDKREQAAIAIELQTKNFRTGNGTVAPEKMAECHRLFELCKKLNGHKGPDPGYEPLSEDDFSHILMLTKSARYYWDADAVKEPTNDKPVSWEVRKAKGEPMRRGMKENGEFPDPHLGTSPMGRNLRNVWTFATQPYSGAHFATFPVELVIRCLQAATKPGDLVLDPFSGSGTVGEVAFNMQRRFVLCDLAYQHLQRERIPPMALVPEFQAV